MQDINYLRRHRKLLVQAAQKLNLEIYAFGKTHEDQTILIRNKKGKNFVLATDREYSGLDRGVKFLTREKQLLPLLQQRGIVEFGTIVLPHTWWIATENDLLNLPSQIAQIGHKNFVVKPVNLWGGDSVELNIEPSRLIAITRAQLRKYGQAIVQTQIFGEDLRIQLVGGKLIGAVSRIRANVIGDGNSTISELISRKNEARIAINYNNKLVLDEQMLQILEKQNLTVDTVLAKGKQIWLRNITNIGAGGDPLDVTDKLPKTLVSDLESVAEQLELNVCGIDMIIDNLNNIKSATLIELNSPNSWTHHYMTNPILDVATAILLQYFDPQLFYKRLADQGYQSFHIDKF